MSAIMTDPSKNNVAELFAPGPGERLRAARLSMNYDLAKIASELHLTTAVVQALEADDYDGVGVRVFVRGYLRNYARIVGMPEESVLRQFDEKWPDEGARHSMLKASPRLPADGGTEPRLGRGDDLAAAAGCCCAVFDVVARPIWTNSYPRRSPARPWSKRKGPRNRCWMNRRPNPFCWIKISSLPTAACACRRRPLSKARIAPRRRSLLPAQSTTCLRHRRHWLWIWRRRSRLKSPRRLISNR